MRIKVKAQGRNINIPIPMWLLKSGFKIATVVGKKQAKKALTKNMDMNDDKPIKIDALKYIDMIDYKILKEAMDELGSYKGLVLVEVHASDGTEVLIKV